MSKVRMDRDLVLRTKLLLPERVWRMATKPAAAVLRTLPDGVKYNWGMSGRKQRYPYKAIQPGDYVMQIGCPADLLKVGRSRSAYFLHMVSGGGKLVVLEPDTDNCAAMLDFAERNGMADRIIVVQKGGWNENKTLRFFQSKEHPASAVLEELCEATPEEMKRRGYHAIEVPVTTVDSVIAELGIPVPKLISITTNGAEIQILDGMSDTMKTPPEFISLAVTGDGYTEVMPNYNYEYFADDDRGFTFRHKAAA